MNRKQIAAVVLDCLIIFFSVCCLILLYRKVNEGVLRWLITIALIFLVAILLVYEVLCRIRSQQVKTKPHTLISTLVLLNEEDCPIHIWDLTGKIGLIIGKSSREYQVDIDLSNSDFHTYIDPEHATLNYHDSGWWIQDTSSRNGLSILRKGDELLLDHHAPAKLEPGDVICIAKYTRIAVN